MHISGVLGEPDTLRAEAEGVHRGLRLDVRLADIGTPTIVGSAALGLMVCGDLDLDVVCECPDDGAVAAVAAAVAAGGARLATHLRMTAERGTGSRTPTPTVCTSVWSAAHCPGPPGTSTSGSSDLRHGSMIDPRTRRY